MYKQVSVLVICVALLGSAALVALADAPIYLPVIASNGEGGGTIPPVEATLTAEATATSGATPTSAPATATPVSSTTSLAEKWLGFLDDE